jgi:hypothetical protein
LHPAEGGRLDDRDIRDVAEFECSQVVRRANALIDGDSSADLTSEGDELSQGCTWLLGVLNPEAIAALEHRDRLIEIPLRIRVDTDAADASTECVIEYIAHHRDTGDVEIR